MPDFWREYERLAACRLQLFVRLGVVREFEMTGCGNLLLKCSAVFECGIGIIAVGRVFHRFGERHEGETAATEEVDEVWQHLRVEGADVEQKDVRNIATVEGVGH